MATEWERREANMARVRNPYSHIETAMTAAQQMRDIVARYPKLAAQPDVLAQLSQGSTVGLDSALGFVDASATADSLRVSSEEDQRATWGQLTSSQQLALRSAGYAPPAPPSGGNIFSRALSKVGDVAEAIHFDKFADASLWLPKQGLNALTYVGEEAKRPFRAMEQVADARNVDPAMLEKLGIATPAEGAPGMMQFPFGQLSGLADPDVMKAWWKLGHDGEDDFRASTQVEVYNDLVAGFGNDEAALDAFRWVKASAAGDDISDFLTSSGFQVGTADFTNRAAQLEWLMTDDRFVNARNKLLGKGHMSLGRMQARSVLGDGVDTTTGWGRLLSGSVDFGYALIADPTLVAGKFAKVAQGARYSLRAGHFVDDINYFREAAKLAEAADAGRDVTTAALALGGRGGASARRFDVAKDVLTLGDKHRVPAQMIVDAAQNGEWAQLQRAIPSLSTSIDSLVQFHNTHGISKLDDVFDFYTQTAQIARFDGRVASTQLFGHDPNRLFLPHGETKYWARDKWRKLTIDKMIDDPHIVNEIKTDLVKRAAARDLGDAYVDDMLTLRVKGGPVRDFFRGFATRTPTRTGLTLDGNEAVQEFTRFVEMGYLAKMPREYMDGLVNLFAQGNVMQRARLTGDAFSDIMRHAGVLDDEAAQQFLRRFNRSLDTHFGLTEGAAVGPEAADALLRKYMFRVDWEHEVPIPKFDDIMIATKKANMMRWMVGTLKQSPVETWMTKAWKPAQLMRVGFITRSAGEEILSLALRTSSLDYLRSKIGNDWARGRRSAGAVLGKAESAWMRPVTSFTGALRGMGGLTDAAIEARAVDLAISRTKNWAALPAEAQAEKIAEAMDQFRPGRIGNVVVEMDELMDRASAFLGQNLHEIARATHLPSKQRIGELILGGQNDAYRVASQMWADPGAAFARATYNDAIAATLRGSSPYTDVSIGLAADDADMILDVDLPMRSTIPVAHPDPLGFAIKGTSEWETQAATAHGRAAIAAQHSFVPFDVADDIAARVGGVIPGNPEQVVGQLRQRIADASYSDRGRIQAYLRTGDPNALATVNDPDLRALVQGFEDAPTYVQRAALTPHSPDVTLDPDVAMTRAEDEVYRQLRNLPADSPTRKVATKAMGDTHLPVPDGHTRVHVVEVDRAAAEALVALMNPTSGTEQMAEFAQNLRAQLTRFGLDDPAPLLADIWQAAHPTATGWGTDEMMVAVRNQLAVGGGRYIPGLSLGTTDPGVARAVRDALHETITRSGLVRQPMGVPTIGVLDIPDAQMSAKFGVNAIGDQGVYSLAPHRVTKAQPLDPADLQLEHLVELPNGRRVWARAEEIDQTLGPVGVSDGVASRVDNMLGRAAIVDEDGVVVVNRMGLLQDYKAGATLLRGGGDPIALGVWPDPAVADLSTRIEQLEAYGGVSLPDVEELLAKIKKMPKAKAARLAAPDEWVLNHPVWGELVNNGVLDDLVELKARRMGKVKPGDTRFIEAKTALGDPKLIARAHTEMGVDADKLVAEIGSGTRYVEFIEARERAGVALGFGPHGTAMVQDQVELNKLASSYAMTKLGIDPTLVGNPTLPALTFDLARDGRVIRTVATDGMSEEAALRRAARAYVAASADRLASPNGRPLHEVTHHLLTGDWDATDMYTKIQLDDLPKQLVSAPRATARDTAWDRTVGRIVEGWFEGVAGPAIAKMARHPQYMFNLSKAQEQMRHVMDNFVNPKLADEAVALFRSKGVDFTAEQWQNFNRFAWTRFDDPAVDTSRFVGWDSYGKAMKEGNWKGARKALADLGVADISDDELRMLRNFHANQSQGWEYWRDASHQRAVDLTVPFIDDHRIRTQMSSYVGSLVPFGYSQEQFMRRVGRMLYQNPAALRRGQLLVNGMTSAAVVREDQFGNKVFVYPTSETAGAVVAAAFQTLGGDPRQAVAAPLSGRIDYLMPGYNLSDNPVGFGPVVALAGDQLAQRIPELTPLAQAFNGGFAVDKPVFEYFLPSSVRNVWTAIHMDNATAVAAYADVARIMAAAGHMPPEAEQANDPYVRQAYNDAVVANARSFVVMKALAGFAGLPTTMKPDGDVWSQEYQQMLDEGLTFDDAAAIMTERHGPMALAFTVYDTKSDVAAPIEQSEQAWRTMIDNEDLFEHYKHGAAWLLVSNEAGDNGYTFNARNQAIAFGLRHRRTPDELLDALYAAEAGPLFQVLEDEHQGNLDRLSVTGDKEAIKAENDAFKVAKDLFFAAHPVFASVYQGSEGREKRAKAMSDVRALLESPRVGEHPNLQAIAPLLTRLDAYDREKSLVQGQTDKAKAVRRQLDAQAYMDLWLIAQKDLVAQAFFNQVVRRDFDNRDEYDEVLMESVV